jgi:hypothetical protein
MRLRFIIAFKESGEVLKEVAECDDKIGSLTKKERKRIGDCNEIRYFDTIDELIEYALEHKKECKIREA